MSTMSTQTACLGLGLHLGVACLALMAGCSPALPGWAQGAETIRLVAPPAGCERLGARTGTFGGGGRDHNIQGARRIALNRAATSGATHLVLERPVDIPETYLVVETDPTHHAIGDMQQMRDPRSLEPPRPTNFDAKPVYAVEKRAKHSCGANCVAVTGIAWRCPR